MTDTSSMAPCVERLGVVFLGLGWVRLTRRWQIEVRVFTFAAIVLEATAFGKAGIQRREESGSPPIDGGMGFRVVVCAFQTLHVNVICICVTGYGYNDCFCGSSVGPCGSSHGWRLSNKRFPVHQLQTSARRDVSPPPNTRAILRKSMFRKHNHDLSASFHTTNLKIFSKYFDQVSKDDVQVC